VPLLNIFLIRLFSKLRLKRKDFQEIVRLTWANGGPSKLSGGTFPSVPSFMSNWSRRNQCGPNPIESAVAADVTRLEYTDCADDAGVVFYTIKGEGHQWPGGELIVAQWMVGRYGRSIDARRGTCGRSFVGINFQASKVGERASSGDSAPGFAFSSPSSPGLLLLNSLNC
jgi:hypothetical protein